MDAYGFGIGAIIEHAATPTPAASSTGRSTRSRFYTTALSQATVTNHYELGRADDATGPTGGSVDAIGLVGTGSRYSTSTTLSLEPQQGHATRAASRPPGNTLLRATATLTSTGGADGVCGTFGTYTLVTGGTDPTSPEVRHRDGPGLLQLPVHRARHAGQRHHVHQPQHQGRHHGTGGARPRALGVHQHVLVRRRLDGRLLPLRRGQRLVHGDSHVRPTPPPASPATPTRPLGTNWTSTPGALGVNTYSWSGVARRARAPRT